MSINKFLKIVLLSAIAVCMVCLFAKSFLAIHTYPEYKGDGVNLMFKLNPLGENFVREDSYEADMESPLHIHKDEMMLIGQDTLEHIFKILLPIYLFVLLLLISVFVKPRNPKLKKRQLIIPTIAAPLFVWVLWLFQTYEPTEKVYSIDGQYSYYFEIYNFNKVKPISMFYTWDFGFAGVRSPYYWYKRKIYLYDEINQRVLASEYFGDMNEIEHYKMGFDYWGDTDGCTNCPAR